MIVALIFALNQHELYLEKHKFYSCLDEINFGWFEHNFSPVNDQKSLEIRFFLRRCIIFWCFSLRQSHPAGQEGGVEIGQEGVKIWGRNSNTATNMYTIYMASGGRTTRNCLNKGRESKFVPWQWHISCSQDFKCHFMHNEAHLHLKKEAADLQHTVNQTSWTKKLFIKFD